MSTGAAAAFAKRVEQARLRLGWTRSELAARAKMSRATIDRLATQERLPLPKTVLTLAGLLGIDRDEALRLAGFDMDPVPGNDHTGAEGMLAWLRATIEADKAVAMRVKAAWRIDGQDTGVIVASDGDHAEPCANAFWAGVAEHVVRHDPRDTIARCEAEMALLDRLEAALNDPINYDFAARNLAEDGITTLASGYRHRAGFREEWAS